jgi:hypothetical protein
MANRLTRRFQLPSTTTRPAAVLPDHERIGHLGRVLAGLATQSGTRALGPELAGEFLARGVERRDAMGSPQLTATFMGQLAIAVRRSPGEELATVKYATSPVERAIPAVASVRPTIFEAGRIPHVLGSARR